MSDIRATTVFRNLKTLIRLLIIGVLAFLLLILSPGKAMYADCSHPWCCSFGGSHMCYDPVLRPLGCSYWSFWGRACSDGSVHKELGSWWACTLADPNSDPCKALGCSSPKVCMWCEEWSQHCDGCWCGPGCFPSGTAIKTGDGQSKEIQDLTVGDQVISFNTETGEEEPATVENIHQVEREGYYRIKVRDLETGEIKELEVTGEHPLYAIQQEDADQEPQTGSLFSRLVGFIEKLVSFLVDLIR